jgi:hypothetical protein
VRDQPRGHRHRDANCLDLYVPSEDTFVLARVHHDAGIFRDSLADRWRRPAFGRFAETRHRAGWRHERTGGDGHADVTAIGRFGTPEGRGAATSGQLNAVDTARAADTPVIHVALQLRHGHTDAHLTPAQVVRRGRDRLRPRSHPGWDCSAGFIWLGLSGLCRFGWDRRGEGEHGCLQPERHLALADHAFAEPHQFRHQVSRVRCHHGQVVRIAGRPDP